MENLSKIVVFYLFYYILFSQTPASWEVGSFIGDDTGLEVSFGKKVIRQFFRLSYGNLFQGKQKTIVHSTGIMGSYNSFMFNFKYALVFSSGALIRMPFSKSFSGSIMIGIQGKYLADFVEDIYMYDTFDTHIDEGNYLYVGVYPACKIEYTKDNFIFWIGGRLFFPFDYYPFDDNKLRNIFMVGVSYKFIEK